MQDNWGLPAFLSPLQASPRQCPRLEPLKQMKVPPVCPRKQQPG